VRIAMKIIISRHDGGGFTVSIDRPLLPERRFKAVCAIAAAGVYAGMVIAAAALCGLSGLIVVGVVTTIIGILATGK